MKSEIFIRNEGDLSNWFVKNYKKLGYTKILRDNNGSFPDFIMLKNKEKIKVELEYYSSNFRLHKHDTSKVDDIVCFKHNSKYNPPLSIIEIKEFFKNQLKYETAFTKFLGNKPNAILWDYILTRKNLDVSITDMAKDTNIGRTSIYRMWDRLTKKKILRYSRKIGKSNLYKLDQNNPLIQKMIELHNLF